MKKVVNVIFAVLGVLFLMGCPTHPEPDPVSEKNSSGVDFADYSSSDYVIKVKNNTQKALVAFKGTPNANNLIGGIPASATNHGLKRDTGLFNTSSDFILFLVSEDDYVSNKSDLSVLATKPFGRLYAYYNSNAANNIVYEISSKMGGSGEITLQNNTAYNVELRKDGINGETIGYTAARTLNTTFSVEPGDYYVFPVFRKFDRTLNEIITVYPKYTSGKLEGQARVEVFNVTDSEPIELNATKWSEGITFTASSAYLRINNSSEIGISLYAGSNSTALTTSTGGKIINSGKSLLFEVPMDLTSNTEGYTYASKKTTSQYRIGNALQADYYITGGSTVTKDYVAGTIYTLTVTGADYGNLSCEFTDETESVGLDPTISQTSN